MFSLAGKVAIVTGGASGIGRGISEMLAAQGAAVLIAARNADKARQLHSTIRATGAASAFHTHDLCAPDSATDTIAAAVSAFGRVDILVNNAGSADPADTGPLIDLTPAQWHRVVDLNMRANFFMAQAFARRIRQQNRDIAAPVGGSLIQISSRSASYPNPMTGHYGAAKAAMESLVATMAVEWGHLNLRVNAIAPGVVVTAESAEWYMDAGRVDKQLETVPLGRLGRPEDIAALCVWLASDAAAWMSGTTLQAHGGSPLPMGYLSYLRRIRKMTSSGEG